MRGRNGRLQPLVLSEGLSRAQAPSPGSEDPGATRSERPTEIFDVDQGQIRPATNADVEPGSSAPGLLMWGQGQTPARDERRCGAASSDPACDEPRCGGQVFRWGPARNR